MSEKIYAKIRYTTNAINTTTNHKIIETIHEKMVNGPIAEEDMPMIGNRFQYKSHIYIITNVIDKADEVLVFMRLDAVIGRGSLEGEIIPSFKDRNIGIIPRGFESNKKPRKKKFTTAAMI